MTTEHTVTTYIKADDDPSVVLAEIALKDGPHADAHQHLDCTRHALQRAFAEIFERPMRVVFDSDIARTDNPGLVFLPYPNDRATTPAA